MLINEKLRYAPSKDAFRSRTGEAIYQRQKKRIQKPNYLVYIWLLSRLHCLHVFLFVRKSMRFEGEDMMVEGQGRGER